ncbi:Inhibitory regulator protein IRA2 [Wickerhamomyces ciferrii]|uniref:Inhibitory regulator protein IRA2 n=1 Tax=Wickerhamomyces ciferrii (strain ATCC 14091 / BCRC 22168 / CBS 111 / JCM 3599 / NBRC 0793 / NRRL Y-1031 F-60-10) TaxID=1206466 RepID=K0KN55_WICCF|nr:Inhibitory regulator protein IRA2 [Wickerhamomyces ciferrii]CCH42769.1 Inhibitory regulator protein IRA2 [Wickerhamomyces ciferrii]
MSASIRSQQTTAKSVTELPLVAHIFNKISGLLPIESDLSIYEVETHAFYLSSRKALINLSTSNLYQDILIYALEILEDLNKRDNYLVLRQRELPSLSSLLIILRLLADLSKFNWDTKEPKSRKNSIDSNTSTTSSSSEGVGIATANVDFHTVQPNSLDPILARRAIALISKFKSTSNLVHELALINGKVAVSNEEYGMRSMTDQIDINVETLLRYFAASNPVEYLNFSIMKLSVLKHNINNEGEFVPYLELFSAVYLNENYILEYLKHLRNILTTIKRSIYRQLLLTFFMKAVKIWINSRPQEYLNCTKTDSNVSMEADALFDEVYSFLEGGTSKISSNAGTNKQFKSSYRFLALLLTLYPRAIESFTYQNDSKSNRTAALKKLTSFNTNKKHKLLSNVTKILSNNKETSTQVENNVSVLESLDFVVCVANIASSIYPYDPQNILVQYSLLHYDIVTKVLVPVSSTRNSPLITHATLSENQVFSELRLEYFSSLCVLNSSEFIPKLMDILNDESTSLESLKLTTSILKMFSSTLHSKESSQNLVRQIFPLLKRVVVRMSTLVQSSTYVPSIYEEETETSSLGKTSSGNSLDFYSQYSFKTEIKFPDQSRQNSSTVSSSAGSVSTPKSEKFKDTTKSIFSRSHHLNSAHQQSSSHSTNTSASSASTSRANTATSDQSIDSTQQAQKVSKLSRDILANSYSIFKKYPQLYFLTSNDLSNNEKYEELIESSNSVLDPFIISIKDSDPKLTTSVTQYLLSFISSNVILDDFDHVMCSFAGSLLILNATAKALIASSSSDLKRRELLEIFVKFLEYRVGLNTLLEHHEYFPLVKSLEKSFYLSATSLIEQALLTCLCTPSFDTYPLIKRGFRAVDSELSFNGSRNHVYERDINKDFYLAVSGDSSLTTGLVALQKNIRKYFLKIKTPSAAVINVWLRIYERWNDMALSNYSEMSQNELAEFRNFAGFLSSVSGIFVNSNVNAERGFTQEIKHEITEKIDEFIQRELVLLGEDNLVTRENAREILAAETHPLSYGRVVKLLVPIVKNYEANSERLSVLDFTVIEHIIVLLKAILNNGARETVFSVSVDLLNCASILARLIDSVPEVDVTILKLRIRMSRFFYEIELHNDVLVIGGAYKLRNTYLRHAYNWFDNAIAYDCNCNDHSHHQHQKHSTGGRDLDYIYIDIAIESVKALSLLLDSLLLEAPQVINERELKFSKASLFSIYFNTFLKALERYSDLEKFPLSVKHKVSTVSDHIITCLTNLLKSNVDVGLQYALPIGYHSNLSIRVAFLKVFVSIVETYKVDDGRHDEKTRALMNDIFKLIFTTPKVLLSIARSCPTSDASALASCSLSLADSVNQSASLVSYLVQEEIFNGYNYGDILRRNSFASKSLSAFGRSKGSEYLVSTLRPILLEIRDSELDLEVEKISPEDPAGLQNLNNFMHYLKKLVNVIIRSIDEFPLEFRAVCQTISSCVEGKFPSYRIIAVGSFIFLRFFCPAIVSPESEKIVDIPNRQTQRKFLMLAKVLQNMANGSLNSLRWPLLKSRTEELNELNEKLFGFLDQCTKLDDDVVFEVTEMSDVNDQDFGFFHRFMYENWQVVRAESLRNCENEDELKVHLKLSTDVMDILSFLGQPTINFGYEIPASISPESNNELFEFMSKYSLKDLGQVQDSNFIYQAISSDGTPLLVFSYLEFYKLKNADQEIALYRIFQIASKIWDQKFSIVVDCTGNNGTQVFPYRLLVLLGNLAPNPMRDNCVSVQYFNLSSGLFPNFFKNSKSPSNFFNQGPSEYFFPHGNDDHKTIANLGLPNESVRAYHDVRAKFTDASLYQVDNGRFVPVVIKIGNEFIQITQTTPQRIKIKGTLKEIYLNDVFRLQDISSVSVSEKTGVSNEITIVFENGSEFILSSPKSLDIMRLLYFTKNRVTEAPAETLFKQNVEKSLEDMLGQLFNIVFLGFTSSSAEIRSISYNLLAAAQKQFNLDLGRELASSPEVYFPRDNNTFVVTISEKLAETYPQVTPEVIGAFFKVYREQVTPRQRFNAIVYVAPWIPNIYEHVYRVDEENGPDFVSEIIRNFLAVSSIDPVFLSAFNSQIWSKLCLEDRISTILVNEIVLTAIDREAEGSDWKSIIALLASTPTVELCGHVIQRLREISHIPFPDSNGNYSVTSHSSWIEITVLVQICVSLFFDSLMFTEMFLPEIFYVVTVLVDVGPLDLRIASHQLLLNVLQSFLTKPTLNDFAKDKIRNTISHFTSHRSRILFGLNRDTADNFPTEISKFATRVSTMETLVAALMEVIEVTGSENSKALWVARWNRYVVDAVSKDDAVLKGRALLLLGVLSKTGVNDTMVVRVMEMVAQVASEDMSDTKYRYLAICTVFSLSRISEGLLPTSPFFGRMFWFALVVTHSDLVALYQGGLQFACKVLTAMHSKDKYINFDVVGTLLKEKVPFGALLDRIEEHDEIVATRDTFDQVLLHYTIKGLQLPYARATSIESLKSFFIIRYLNEVARVETDPSQVFDNSVHSYLLFLYILLKPDDVKSLLRSADVLSDDVIELGEQAMVPRVLVNYLLSDNINSNLSLLQAAVHFEEGEPNEKSMIRLLLLLKYIGQRNPRLVMKVYFKLRPTIRKIISTNSSSVPLVTACFNLASIASIQTDYEEDEKFKHFADQVLDENSVRGIYKYKFPEGAVLLDEKGANNPSEKSRGSVMKPLIETICAAKVQTE